MSNAFIEISPAGVETYFDDATNAKHVLVYPGPFTLPNKSLFEDKTPPGSKHTRLANLALKGVPTLNLPCVGVLNVESAIQAFLDLWRAVGAGYSLVFPLEDPTADPYLKLTDDGARRTYFAELRRLRNYLNEKDETTRAALLGTYRQEIQDAFNAGRNPTDDATKKWLADPAAIRSTTLLEINNPIIHDALKKEGYTIGSDGKTATFTKDGSDITVDSKGVHSTVPLTLKTAMMMVRAAIAIFPDNASLKIVGNDANAKLLKDAFDEVKKEPTYTKNFTITRVKPPAPAKGAAPDDDDEPRYGRGAKL